MNSSSNSQPNFRQKALWVVGGLVCGVMTTAAISAYAVREPLLPVPVEDLRLFSEVYARIKNDYVEQVPDKKLIREAIKGMVSGLDPHSSFLDEKGITDMKVSTEGKFGGVGIEIGNEDGFIKVVAPIDDTPAQRSGIRSGDLIITVDGESTKGLTTEKAVGKMRGTPGTKVKLEIFRKNDNSSLTYHLTREEIKIWSVKAKMLPEDVGYVRIRSFQSSTITDFNKAAQELESKSPKSLILDLRDDPGGVLDGAVGISAAFLPENTLVVYTDGRTSDSKMRLSTNVADYNRRGGENPLKGLPERYKTIPIVVLVNGGSASASEIVAGALKDHGRATLMGVTTFGKGSVQSLQGISGGLGLKLTTSRYYTPKGTSIQLKGIDPDVTVEQITFDGEAIGKRFREQDYDNSLNNEKNSAASEKNKPTKTPAGEDEDVVVKRNNSDRFKNFEAGNLEKDYQLAQAYNKLTGKPVVVSTKAVITADASKAAPGNQK